MTAIGKNPVNNGLPDCYQKLNAYLIGCCHNRFKADADSYVSVQACINDCNDCVKVCTQTLGHCLEMGGEHADSSHINALLDCIALCREASSFMLRNSKFNKQICALCAEVCRDCAYSCEKIDETGQMKTCADVCRKCDRSCQGVGRRLRSDYLKPDYP